MTKENINKEDSTYEEIKQEFFQHKKGKGIRLKPRQEFELANQDWIGFLQDYQEGRLIKQEGNKAMDSFFASWQSENGFMYYDSFKAFLCALARWMYENLKSIVRGGKYELIDIDGFGVKQVNEIIAQIHPVTLPQMENKKFIFMDCFNICEYSQIEQKNTMISLAKMLHSYIIYIEKYCNGMAAYKVAVCPYYKGKGSECGKVVITERFGETCEKHMRLWVQRRIDKAKRGQTVLYKK